jgi:hypothetical protein
VSTYRERGPALRGDRSAVPPDRHFHGSTDVA